MRAALYTALSFATLLISTAAPADPWKDESGKGKWRGDYGWYDDRTYAPRRDRNREAARIPPGHLPPPGECRVWYRSVPPGHQPPPFRC
jgi:hypothetical protein